MCGANASEKQAQTQEALLATQMSQDFTQIFGENQAILGSLTQALSPIVQAGPNQQGFSPAELQNLNNTATNASAQGAQNAQIAAQAKEAVAGGGSTVIPSGANQQINAMINNSAGQNLANEKESIQEANYATGRQNFFTAENQLAGAPGNLENASTSAGNAATNSAANALQGAQVIQQANDEWVQDLFGTIGAIGGAALGHL